jgi:hypothetical protein
MAARTRRPHHNDKSREKIQVSQIVNRLQKHVLGEVDMSTTQVRSAEILLKKKLPDLSSTELNATIGIDHESALDELEGEDNTEEAEG